MGSQEGVSGIARTVNELVTAVVKRSERPSTEVQAALAHEPFATATRILAMFIWLTGDDSPHSKVGQLSNNES